ncbi:hypothetical protein UCRNP2_10376 [Neofusicoccum parvum UCRNP2]|uniref:Uncharacterized protein n=1 Tax=Botryosphaeria parva (strain UCR-NP2) TaxID=1287680 RepID=R1G4D1_BOTPV|nr:hypothetical protein UCRNP2_10376 [Neofusicoccum parvum UCRNP2]
MRFGLATAALLLASAQAAPRPTDSLRSRSAIAERGAALAPRHAPAAGLGLDGSNKSKRWFTLRPRQEGEGEASSEGGEAAGEGEAAEGKASSGACEATASGQASAEGETSASFSFSCPSGGAAAEEGGEAESGESESGESESGESESGESEGGESESGESEGGESEGGSTSEGESTKGESSTEGTTEASEESSSQPQAAGQGDSNLITAASVKPESAAGKSGLFAGWSLLVSITGIYTLL